MAVAVNCSMELRIKLLKKIVMAIDCWLNSEHDRFNIDLYYRYALSLLILAYIFLRNDGNSMQSVSADI